MARPPTPTRWLEPDQQHAWRSFLLGTTRLFEQLERDLRGGHDLSLPEYEILVRLSEAPDRRLRMAELASSVSHSRSRVTHTIARLEATGLVARSACPTDGRGVIAALTHEGYARLVDAAPTHVAGVRRYLVDLVDADDLAATGRVFAAVAGALDQRTVADPGAQSRVSRR
jgi:DNA-binding MarR family transcriptional regulator